MKNLRIEALLLLLLLPLVPFGRLDAAPDLGESLDYTLRFRGLLSGFMELDIAQMSLSVGPSLEEMTGRPAYPTRMRLTTEFYKKAELIYPVRLDYRSWLDEKTLQPLVAVKSLVTRAERREIFWFNQGEGQAYHYQTPKPDASEPGQTLPDPLLQMTALTDQGWSGLQEHLRIPLDEEVIVDYMGMLHQLRQLPAEPGKWFGYTVFTGKRLQHYRVLVDKDRLVRRGWDRDALFLKLFEYDPEQDELKDEVQVWLSDDEQRLLLRFYAESAAGALEGILETGRPDNGHQDELSDSTRRSLETYLDF